MQTLDLSILLRNRLLACLTYSSLKQSHITRYLYTQFVFETTPINNIIFERKLDDNSINPSINTI